MPDTLLYHANSYQYASTSMFTTICHIPYVPEGYTKATISFSIYRVASVQRVLIVINETTKYDGSDYSSKSFSVKTGDIIKVNIKGISLSDINYPDDGYPHPPYLGINIELSKN